ncbi:hypothetical protein PG984_003025 [Apiospora sp. TS-2023a]
MDPLHLCLLLLGFAPCALANFWVFSAHWHHSNGFMFFNCDTVNDATWWDASGDVSGGKKGVRVVGPANDPDTFEANVLSVHWTYYKARGQKIYDLSGKDHGFCRPIGGVTNACAYEIQSIFHCSSDYTAEEMGKPGYQTGPP